jgi:scyllo-inositol 2-dehydrogenase (NADP+)
MDRVKVGLIGFGLAGSVFHAPLLMSEPRMRLTAIATSRALSTDYANVRAYPDAKQLIESDEVDLIVIATPNETHAPLAEAALEAGKHVVIDKPFAIDLKDADKLMALAARQQRLLSVFHNRRWDGNFLTARAVLSRADIGEINYCEIHFDRFRPKAKTGWRETDQPGSGVLYDLGPHLIDQALCLFGMPEAVIADVTAQRDGVVADDYFHLQLIYTQSLRVVLHASCLALHEGPRLVAHGNKGSLVVHGLDGQEAALAAGARPGDSSWGTTETVQVLVINDAGRHDIPVIPGAYEQYYRSIAVAVLDGQEPAVTTKQARDVMAVLDAARQSAVERRWVSPVV